MNIYLRVGTDELLEASPSTLKTRNYMQSFCFSSFKKLSNPHIPLSHLLSSRVSRVSRLCRTLSRWFSVPGGGFKMHKFTNSLISGN